METAGNLLITRRKAKRISLKKAARDLRIKTEHLQALENSQWQTLPEPIFVKGFIKSYAQYLNLDPDHLLALYRREYDEANYSPKASPLEGRKRFMLTPKRLLSFAFIFAIIIFIIYVSLQYFSILSAPKLEVTSPPNDFATNVPYVIVSGKVEKETTVAIGGEFVAVDSEGNFSYQLTLVEGKNVVEIIAAKRLSPKTKIVRTVRLTR